MRRILVPRAEDPHATRRRGSSSPRNGPILDLTCRPPYQRPVTETTGPGYRVERVDHEGGLVTLRFVGELRFRQCFPSWEAVGRLARPPGARTELDLAEVQHLDGAAAALLLDLRHKLAADGGD